MRATSLAGNNQATLTITNLTFCTPDIRINGEVVIVDFGDTPTGPYSAVLRLNSKREPHHSGDLPLLTVCLEQDNHRSGLRRGYSWEFD